jgi:hypothetical protein
MHDALQDVVAPTAIERAMSIYEQFRDRDQTVLEQARRIVTKHIFAMIDGSECDPHKLTVSGLAHLMAVERDHEIKGACVATNITARHNGGRNGR